jgi:hypothetical protein
MRPVGPRYPVCRVQARSLSPWFAPTLINTGTVEKFGDVIAYCVGITTLMLLLCFVEEAS